MSTHRYDLENNENKNLHSRPRLRYISSAAYGGDWHSTPHTHHCSELFFVTSGVGQFLIENHIYPVGTNDLIIVNPNVIHTEVSLDANPLEYIVLGVDGFELSQFHPADQPYTLINCYLIRETLLSYFQTMLREIETKAFVYEMICQNIMEILILLLMRQSSLPLSLVPSRKKSSHLCSTVRRYIDVHYRENLTLDHLIKISHVSKYYLVHAFSKEYGISPINYLISRRIEEAKQLLKNDDYPLTFISRFLGFSSPSYFSQTFKKTTGRNPNEYRKQSRNEK